MKLRRRIHFLAGQYELEEREDADSAKTLMELTADGKALLGSTDGIPFADSKGRWEYDGKELILELTRTFEDVKSAFPRRASSSATSSL